MYKNYNNIIFIMNLIKIYKIINLCDVNLIFTKDDDIRIIFQKLISRKLLIS